MGVKEMRQIVRYMFPITVFLLIFLNSNPVLAGAATIPPGALVWEECPDFGTLLNEYGTQIPNSLNLYDICHRDLSISHIKSKYFLASDWYNYAPVEEENIEIVSVELIVKMRGCEACNICNKKLAHAEIWVWNNDIPGNWKKLETANVYNDIDYVFDLTSSITPNGSGAHKVKIKNSDDQGTCLWIDYVGLRIVYYEMGEARIWVTPLDIEPSSSVSKYSRFASSSSIECIGGDCGNVKAYIRYSDTETYGYQNVPTSSTVPMYSLNPDPYIDCGNMYHLDECYPSWEIIGTSVGNYYLRMSAESTETVNNNTSPVLISINPGELDMSASITSNIINYGDNVKIDGGVMCITEPCGNVNVVAEYRDVSGVFEPIGTSGDLSTGNTNPVSCTSYLCATSWYVTGNQAGNYGIRVTAYSDDEDVDDVTRTMSLTVNPQEVVGVLSLENVMINPGNVNISGTSTLSGTVKCSEDYCGDVSVYARSSGEKITSNGLGIDNNPKIVGGMDNGDSYPFSFTLTGNTAGTYYIDVEADSDQTDVLNKTSSVVYLTVSNPVGDVYFPFEPSFIPDAINIGGTASISAVVECDTSYCEASTATLSYDGTAIGTTGKLTTNEQNPQSCDSYPCELAWDITGGESGSYDVSLSITTGYTGGDLFRSYSLNVIDPSKPSLSVTMGNLNTEYVIGETFTLAGEVSCHTNDCGEIRVYAKHKGNENDPWIDLTPSTMLSTSSNPNTITLASGESKQVEWTINSSQFGNYILGLWADATSDGVTDSGTASRSVEIVKGSDISIDIQSPDTGKTLAMGDEFILKVEVKEGGYQMVGAQVTASSEKLFSSVELDEYSDGIYSKTITVGGGVGKGSHIISFYVKKDSQTFIKTTNVYVNPELDVSLELDSDDYEILDKVKLQGQVLKNGKPVKATIGLRLVCPSREFMEITLETDGSGNYQHDHLISTATPAEKCTFELNTVDSDGNYNHTSKEITIFPSGSDVYKVNFVSPLPDKKYDKGDTVKIRVGVLSGDDPLDGAEVVCMNPMLEENIYPQGIGNGNHETSYIIPNIAPDGLWVLTCVAGTDDGSFGKESTSVYINPMELRLEIISPSRTDFQPGEIANIRIKLSYPDNTPFSNSTVYLRIGGQNIYLEETEEPGVYETSYEIKGQGAVIDVYAEDQFGNEGSFSGGIIITAGFAPLNLYWIILPFVIAVLMLAGVVWKKGIGREVVRKEVIIREPEKPKVDKKAELKERIQELDRKIANIEKARDTVEQEYYERKIDEKTFNKMAQNYEQERIKLNVDRDSLKKELETL